jgi:peptidyl-prolyl cis-trans isomerase SurA
MQKPVHNSQGDQHAWKEAGFAAAHVGDEIITFHELHVAFNEYCQRNNLKQLSREERNEIAKALLKSMIERTLLVQEAKRELKNAKQIDKFMEFADRIFREEHLPPLLSRFAVDSEQQLREKLREQNRSLEAMQQTFRQEFLAQNFLMEKLKGRLKVELPERLRYYDDHVDQHEFDRPALITWRDLVVETSKYPNPEAARRKADALLETLHRGADFARLARAESDGPTSSKNQGGLMETSPGGYAIPTVNAALESLPLGQISNVIESPTSFHIIRVEKRRPAGPATFEEVQDQILSLLSEKKLESERKAFLKKLYRKALVSSVFDGTESAPSRTSG